MKLFKFFLLGCMCCTATYFASASGQEQSQNSKSNINKLDRKKRRHGQWEFYWDDSNSVVASKGKFKHGLQVKEWYYYSQDGKLERTEKQTLLGKRLKTVMYHPNGKVWKTGMARIVMTKEYVDYYWYGDWKCYDEYGNFEKVEHYKEGKLEGSVEQVITQ